MVGLLDLLFPPDDLSRGKAGSPTGSAAEQLKLAKLMPGGGAPFMPTNPPLPTARPDAQLAPQEAPAVDAVQTESTGPSGADPYLGWQRGLGSTEGPDRAAPSGMGGSGGNMNWRELLGALGPALMMADPLGRNQGMAAAMMRRNDQRREDAQTAQNQNATKQRLLTQGLDAGTASMLVQDPAMLRQWFGDRNKRPDPKDALELEKMQLEVDRMRNPQAKDLINAGDGRLYDPNSRQSITAAAGAGGGKSFTTEQDLRKEYTSLPEYKRFDDVRASYDRVRASAARGSGPGDLGLIFGFMKMLDPGSVVREGELANAENAAGVPDRVRNLYNRVINGERLTREQRQEFVGTAGDLYGAEANRMGTLNDRYSGIAGQYGIDPGRVIVAPQQYEPLTLPEDKPAATGLPKAPPKIDEIRYGYRFKGGDPAEPSNWEKL